MQLSGAAAPDLWSSKGIYRVGDGAPAPEVLAVCGWPEQACPPIAAAWSPRGTVTAAAARRGDVEGGGGLGPDRARAHQHGLKEGLRMPAGRPLMRRATAQAAMTRPGPMSAQRTPAVDAIAATAKAPAGTDPTKPAL